SAFLLAQFARVREGWQALGTPLDKPRGAYELAVDRFARGKGNMVKRVGDLAKHGAKVKRPLPADLVMRSDDAADLIAAADSGADALSLTGELEKDTENDLEEN